MRKSMKESLKETVQGLQNIGIKTAFTSQELDELGITEQSINTKLLEQKINSLPDSLKKEVIDFVDFLIDKHQPLNFISHGK